MQIQRYSLLRNCKQLTAQKHNAHIEKTESLQISQTNYTGASDVWWKDILCTSA